MKRLLSIFIFTLIIFSAFAQNDEKQEVIIKYFPTNAILMVDGEMVEAQDGQLTFSLTIGEHVYSLVANGYYQQNGSIVVKKDKPCKVVIELLPKDGTEITPQNVTTFNRNAGKEGVHKDVKKTTSATIMPKMDMTFDDIVNNPIGFVICNGDKWTMTADVLHAAFNTSKIKCDHTPWPGMENLHTVKKSNYTRKYRGQKMYGGVITDNESTEEYIVGLANNTEKETDDFLSNILGDFNAAGISIGEISTDQVKSNCSRFVVAFCKEILHVYHAEDENNLYEIIHSCIVGLGKRYQCFLVVSKK